MIPYLYLLKDTQKTSFEYNRVSPDPQARGQDEAPKHGCAGAAGNSCNARGNAGKGLAHVGYVGYLAGKLTIPGSVANFIVFERSELKEEALRPERGEERGEGRGERGDRPFRD
jgi:hypothetical protein